MLLDSQLLFSDAQAITATADSTNVVDIGVARDIGVGEELYLFALVTVAMTDASSDSTVNIDLVTDDNASLTSDSVIMDLVTVPATSAAGTLYYWRIPPAVLNEYEQYIGLTYTVAGGDLTTGSFTAGIVKDIQHFTAYASGYSIS